MAIVGIILLLMGALWTLQGLGLVGGSFMTGESRWILIGSLTAILGAALLGWARWRRR